MSKESEAARLKEARLKEMALWKEIEGLMPQFDAEQHAALLKFLLDLAFGDGRKVVNPQGEQYSMSPEWLLHTLKKWLAERQADAELLGEGER
jgi:hypothetical protein